MDTTNIIIITQPTPESIRGLLRRHGLTREAAGALVHSSLHSVNAWLAPVGAARHRAMPLGAWELLLLKVGEHPTKRLVDR